MNRAAIPFAVAAALVSTIAGATPTRREVLSLPPDQAAEALLRQISPRFAEMAGHQEGDGGPALITFAAAPESSGERGICRARLLRVQLGRTEDPAGPPVITDIDTDDAYKVVGEAQPMRPTGDAERVAQERLCARAGPVLAREQFGALAPGFFTYGSSGHPWLAVAALQGAIAQARAGEFGEVSCDPHSGDCSDPRGRLAGLDLGGLIRLEMAHEGGTLRFHLSATFRPSDPDPAAMPLQLSIVVEGLTLPDSPVFFTYVRAEFSPGLYY